MVTKQENERYRQWFWIFGLLCRLPIEQQRKLFGNALRKDSATTLRTTPTPFLFKVAKVTTRVLAHFGTLFAVSSRGFVAALSTGSGIASLRTVAQPCKGLSYDELQGVVPVVTLDGNFSLGVHLGEQEL